MDTTAPPPIDLDFRPVVNRPDEIAAISGLFQTVWPEHPVSRPDCLDWLYFQNPRGNIIGFNAWHGNTLAAHYVVAPIAAEYRGKLVPAALSLNTATHPDYQRRGLFVKLASATYARARDMGLHHVIGVANDNSTPGCVRNLKFQNVGPLKVHVGIALPSVVADAAPPDTSWRRHWTPDDLAWRLRNPGLRYGRQRAGQRVAVLAPTGKVAIQAVLKIEGDAGLAGTIRAGIRSVLPLGPRMWMGLSRRIQPATASMELPKALRIRPLNLIFLPLQDDRDAIDMSTTEFEALDFDAY